MSAKISKVDFPEFPSETTFVLYDPSRSYAIDQFGSEKVLRQYWLRPWKNQPYWNSRKKQCLGLEFDGGKKPKLLRIFFWKE